MKVIVAGSRNWTKREWLFEELDRLHETLPITEVVSGGAKGADFLGEVWAVKNHVTLKRFPAEWRRPDGTVDKAAGFKRNVQMAEYADALAAFSTGTNGTAHMLKTMSSKGKPTFLFSATT